MTQTTKILKLNEIASWWLPETMKDDITNDVRAALPPLQRGFVWKTSQIELLWDSIAQGFPIGSLLLSKESGSEVVEGSGSDGMLPNPDYLILDGQQRATALALGFRDIWSVQIKKPEEIKEALWVDLVKIDKDDRRFSFRVVTVSHPWGYSRNSPESRLSAHMARESMIVYRKMHDNKKKQAHELDRRKVFPWDAKAPVPLALLIKAIRVSDEGDCNDCPNNEIIDDDVFYKKVVENLKEKISCVSIFNFPKEDEIEKNTKDKVWKDERSAYSQANKMRENVNTILSGNNDEGLRELIYGLRYALKYTEVPASVLVKFNQFTAMNNRNGAESESDEKTPVFNLFKRINNGGTSLTREEINYSMLKVKWPGARNAIEGEHGLLSERKIAHPARMVALIARLFLMTKVEGANPEKLQADLTISQFSSLLEKDVDRLKLFCENKGKEIVKLAWCLLSVKSDVSVSEPENNKSLPIVLAARFSQQADDLLLLLMYWLHCVDKPVPDDAQTRTLGFITAVSWFAEDLNRCVRRLMKELHGLIKDSEDLSKFFNDERFKSILKKDESGRVLMKPLPPPEKLKNAIKDPIIDNPEFTINIDEHTDFQNLKLWNKTDLWQHYCGSGGENVPKNILSYFSEQLDLDKISDRPRIGDIWWRFLHRVSYDRRFLLYAQRSIMKDWFDWFDPTLPDQIRDHNRPWDYDHILPYSWAHHETKIKSEIKHLVRLWVNVNGNLRVWPLELNRSKGNGGIVEECINEYGLMNIKSVCSASFIKGEGAEWRAIESKVREGMVPNSEGNKFFREQGNHWKVFIEASMDRTVDIYKEWYDKLLIRELMK